MKKNYTQSVQEVLHDLGVGAEGLTYAQAEERLAKYGVKPYRIFVYLLVQDIESAERRALALRDAGVTPFAQPYRDFVNNTEPGRELKRFARWVNHKAIFNTVERFADYK